MSGLHVDTSAMNMNGKETVTNAEYFANELTNLRNNIEGLMAIWKGLAANEFQKSYEEQANNLLEFQRLLDELGEAISHSANILNQTEEDNANAGAHLF